MLTLPRVVERPASPYIAVKARVTLPFDAEIPGILARLFAYLHENGLQEAGPVFFKHNVIDMRISKWNSACRWSVWWRRRRSS